jgi:SAM-dependent methyltransferase
MDYAASLREERRIFDHCVDVHDLPGIFHYWSETHLQPKALRSGFADATALFATRLNAQFAAHPGPPRFCSLGSGNADLEIELARRLRAAGRREFTFDCVDLNSEMRARGTAAAIKAGVADHLNFIEGDLNYWTPAQSCDAILANQSLHHIVNLEGLLDASKQALGRDGIFLISDMIGRNGHQRWPEALEIIQQYWKALPPSYRVNCRTGRYEHEFEDWDCSGEGFEGVRAQDILPLLIDRFEFHLFFPFGNLIDPFVDRTFGPNFDRVQPCDRAFIDEVHNRDHQELIAGHLKPTHIIAVAGTGPVDSPVFADGLSPRFCVRPPHISVSAPRPATPEPAATEHDKVALMLRDLTRESETWKSAALQSEKNFEERTDWALALDRELEAASARVVELEGALADRTAWALRSQSDLESELKKRTAWALGLEKELEEKTLWTEILTEEQANLWQRIADLEKKLGYFKEPWKAVRPVCRRILESAVSAANGNRNAKTARRAGSTGE